MKTNQKMIRKMGQFNVIQRTSDSMFNATSLLDQWNKSNGMQKQMIHYVENNSTKEFIKTIEAEENTKERNSVLSQKRGKNGGTWMHPLLFIDFAMWINPKFKYHVLKFVSDEMIKYRHEAGDEYRNLSAAICKIVPSDFMQTAMKKIAEALNWIVFNSHESGIRNKFGDEQKQRELSILERKVTDLINEGFISEYKPLISYLRELYHRKNYPKVFITN
jgi:hypothetical protein